MKTLKNKSKFLATVIFLVVGLITFNGCKKERDEDLKSTFSKYKLSTIDVTTFDGNFITLNSNKELVSFIEKIQAKEIDVSFNEETTQSMLNKNSNSTMDEDPIYVYTTTMRSTGGYYTQFQWQKAGGNRVTVNSNQLTVGLSGMTLGTSIKANSKTISSTGTVINYEVHAEQNYHLIVEGIGTVYTSLITIKGTFDTITRQGKQTVSYVPL